MAYLKAHALIVRIREVLEDSRGVGRTVPPGRFVGNLPQGLSETEQMRRALTKAPTSIDDFPSARVRVNVNVLGRSPWSPPINSNIILYNVTVAVTTLRTIQRKEQLSPDLYDDIQALAIEDGDIVRQALEYPRNLLATEAAEPTHLVSGMLIFANSVTGVIRDINGGAQKLETTHNFNGVWKDYPGSTASYYILTEAGGKILTEAGDPLVTEDAP